MSQHDYTIANQGFPATRADINNALSAIATNNSGTSAPSTQYAGQFWIDTTSSTWTLYIHDGTDDIQFATIDTSANTVNFTDSALDVVTDTTPQLGGNLDLNSNDITGTGDINITGTGTFSGDLTVDTNTLYVDSTNNRVGIGTTSPGRQLEVYDDGTNGQAELAITAQNTDPSRIFFADPDDNNIGILDYDHSVDAMRFSVNNAERMRIDSSGNVGIGTSSPDDTANRVTLELDDTWGGRIINSIGGTATSQWSISTSNLTLFGSIVSEPLAFTTNNLERMRIDDAGQVGIGTVSPAYKFHVEGLNSTRFAAVEDTGLIVGGFGASGVGGVLDWDDASNARSGNGKTLLQGTATNGPGGSTYFHSFTFVFESKGSTGNMTQLAIAYNSNSLRYMRYRFSGSWSAWSAF